MSRDLIHIMESKLPIFSKGQKKIAEYILANYDKAAYMTAAKLGRTADVSESTVVRFANEMGYEGYPELQRALQNYVRTKLTAFQRIEVSNILIGNSDLLDKVLLSDAEKIRHTLEELNREVFRAAIVKIAAAKHIYIMGMRSSSSLAGFLYFNFQMIFDNIKLVQTTSGSEMFEQIMRIGEGDVMIAISFPRYSKRVINAVEFARNKGADVIALTDSKMSPIAQYATELLTAQSDMASFVDSLVAPLSIINAIIVAVSRVKEKELSERLKELEEIWDEYDVYDKSHN